MGDGLKDFHKLGELASSCSMIMSKLIAALQHGGFDSWHAHGGSQHEG